MLRLRVKEVLEQKKISMTRASRIADLNYKTVRDMVVHPDREVAYTTLYKLAKALQVEVSDLIEEVSD